MHLFLYLTTFFVTSDIAFEISIALLHRFKLVTIAVQFLSRRQ